MATNSELLGVRLWPIDRKKSRLKEIGQQLTEAIAEREGNLDRVYSDLSLMPVLDECVVIWLEVMREAFPEDSPLELLEELVQVHEPRSGSFDLMSRRFLDTKVKVEEFRDGDAVAKAKLRPILKARGII